MEKLKEYFKRDSAFWGDEKLLEWHIAGFQNRDSDCLQRSNWHSMLKELGGEGKSVQIINCSHWACGWLEYLIVKPGTTKEKRVQELRDSLEGYPVLDESHYSELEQEEATQTWQNCYDKKERLEYIRENRSQFDFRDFNDLMENIRGTFFSGYASELIN